MRKVSRTQILWTRGEGVFSNKLKMARAQNLKAAIIFWVNRWQICRVFNYCTKFQTIWFKPFNYSRKVTFFLKISYLHAQLKGNSSPNPSMVYMKDLPLIRTFLKYLGLNINSEGEIACQNLRCCQIWAPCCSFHCRLGFFERPHFWRHCVLRRCCSYRKLWLCMAI
jgi:hypothetical protein